MGMRKAFQFFAIFCRKRCSMTQDHQRAAVGQHQFDMAQVANALQLREAFAHFWQQCLKLGHQNGALFDIDDVAGISLAKTHFQTRGFGLIVQAQTRPAAVAPGFIGDHFVDVVLQQARQSIAFAALL